MNRKDFIKILISLSMLGLILSYVDLHKLRHTLLSIPAYVAIVVIFGYFLGQIISSLKWWLIARHAEIKVPYSVAIKAYFIGCFVNSFGFGVLGGDVVRGVLITDGKFPKITGIASVLADRAQGLCVLALIGTISAALYGSLWLGQQYVGFLWLMCAGIAFAWFFGPVLVLKFFPESAFKEKLKNAFLVLPKSSGILISITVLSALTHTLQIALHQAMAVGLGIQVSWSVLFIVVPFVNILCSLPISWNGLGVRETAYAFFLSQYLTEEQSIAFGAIWLMGVTVTSGIGGIVSILGGHDIRLRQTDTAAQS